MERIADRLIVITGGPGSGKTSLIRALAAAGAPVAEEAGRRIIREQMAQEGRALPWIDPLRFADAMLREDIESFSRHESTADPVYFDRAIPDFLGYLEMLDLPSRRAREAASRYRYHRRVFIAPHWPEIYVRDGERRQSPDEAMRTHATMQRIYAELGYSLIELPKVSIAARVQFIQAANAMAYRAG